MENITITKEKYEYLLDRNAMLSALEQGGVDNWQWYSESLEEYNKKKEEKEKRDSIKKALSDAFSDMFSTLGEGINEPAGRGAGYGLSEKSMDDAENIIIDAIIEKVLKDAI